MKKLISFYQTKITKCNDSIERIEEAIKESYNDSRICVIDLVGEKEGVVRDKQLYTQFIKDIESTELVKACTELNKGDGFAHVKDVVTMISKAGNILEIHANNNGNSSTIATAMQNIANNINNSL